MCNYNIESKRVQDKKKKSKGHISCTWVQYATFWRIGQGGHLGFTDRHEKHKLDRGCWGSCFLSQFRQNPFSGLSGEVEKCFSQSKTRAAILFFDGSARKNTQLGRGRWVLAFCQVSSEYPFSRFRRRSQKCESLRKSDGQDDGQRAMTIAHLSLRLRWAKKSDKWRLLVLGFLSEFRHIPFRERGYFWVYTLWKWLVCHLLTT